MSSPQEHRSALLNGPNVTIQGMSSRNSLPDILLVACAVIELLPSNQQEEIEETDV